MTSTHNVT